MGGPTGDGGSSPSSSPRRPSRRAISRVKRRAERKRVRRRPACGDKARRDWRRRQGDVGIARFAQVAARLRPGRWIAQVALQL